MLGPTSKSLASIQAGVRLARKAKSLDQVTDIFDLMQKSTLRMAKLVDNVMDFARGRLGGGLPLDLLPVSLEPVLQQVLDELISVYPERKIETRISVPQQVKCDAGRISQLLSNLLANALTHGEWATYRGERADCQ